MTAPFVTCNSVRTWIQPLDFQLLHCLNCFGLLTLHPLMATPVPKT